ncbi:D-cysteine desulfhydrase family protein [Saccharospirillum impatiens]|uniref:D-cysteine desulfhydrase family protein n=1 Tax=Saccharospirillum impatiens TaxID=169438 RepID=UPI00041187C2|nr:D-cysteine desulfhydrase family protein [Saccharospirillum impatiens]
MAFSNIPKLSLAHAPTPIEHLPRLGEQLGTQNLWVKRDDCTGLGLGGNKTRKLEYLLAEALDTGADTVLTVGGLQSNHARQTAAAAARLGLNCELILEPVTGTPEALYHHSGNVLLNRLFGATLTLAKPGQDGIELMHQRSAALSQEGYKPFCIPVGGSNTTGALGYVECAREIADWQYRNDIEFDHIILATGSAGTQAGLLAGAALFDLSATIRGFCVSRAGEAQSELVLSLTRPLFDRLGLCDDALPARIVTDGDYVGPGYGIETEGMKHAVRVTAETEGLLLDPVYTGKAMHGLFDSYHSGFFGPDDRVLFIHTGGAPALFGYETALFGD